MKLSEQALKITTPGLQQVRRFRSATEFVGDAIYDLSRPVPPAFTIVDPLDPTRRKHFAAGTPGEDLLVPIFRRGQLVYQAPTLPESRARAQQQLALLAPGIKRSVNPHQYPVGLERGLFDLRTRLILEARGVGA